ncbi:MAG: hypothetical protein XD81_0850 [Bacteroidetes bacterium 38_7]|nr:MAG: hypothetical protein XD81_0850 [Bacteroidetes bacterium 38_7]HAL64710.1 hypothetical protein [Bacteroidales bacterium]
MEKKKKLRCPLGIPGGIIAALVGLILLIVNLINGDYLNALLAFALMLLGLPFVRVTMMVHLANDRLDEIEEKLNNNKE